MKAATGVRKSAFVAIVALLTLSPSVAGEGVHESRWSAVDLDEALPADLQAPEGKTRWDFSSLVLGASTIREVSFTETPGEMRRRLFRAADGAPLLQQEELLRSIGEDDARRWLLPQTGDALLAVDGLKPIRVQPAGGETEYWILSRRVGMGWLFLPSRPWETVLQRVLVMRREKRDEPFRPFRLEHRWVDPRAGVVAEVSGPASADGTQRLEIDRVEVIDQLLQGGTPLRLYIDQVDLPPRSTIRLGYDQERRCTEGGNLCRTTTDCAGGSDVCAEIPISILTPDAHATIGDLAAATQWDFSANNLTNYPGLESVASMGVEVSADQTSAFGECGFSATNGRTLGREDKNFTNPNIGNLQGDLNIIASVTERTGGVSSTGNIWLRAAVNNEGVPGSGFTAESRVCYDPLTGRTPVPLWEFANEDPPGEWYLDMDDSWANPTPFSCEQIIFTNAVITDTLYIDSCSALGGLSGEQRSTAVNDGPVTLPSGHTFNAVVVRNTVEYCTYLSGSCFLSFQDVRVVLHLFQVPALGTVVRLMSGTSAPSVTGFSTLDETDIKYGLFPPRSVTVDGTGADTVDISWDPGLITDHIDRYRVYWDTQSGASTGGVYAFDSVNNPGQVAFNGTSATVGGLTPGQQYFFTVTSVTDYEPPADCSNNPCSPTCPAPGAGCGSVGNTVVDTIESVMFPTTLGPDNIPMEVDATPGGACPPTLEIENLVVDKTAGTDIELCWDLTADQCVDGYSILSAAAPEAVGNFSVLVNDTGLTNCATVDTADGFFLVVGKGSGGTGPLGHYEQ